MDHNIMYTHLTAAAACAYLLVLLQRIKSIPQVTAHTTRINFYIRLFLSGFSALGISWAWSGTGTWYDAHSVVINIPALSVIAHAAWSWFGQYAIQHGWGQVFNIGTLKTIDNPVEIKQADPQPAGGK